MFLIRGPETVFAGSGSSLHQVKIKSCNQKNICFELTTSEARQSTLQNLYAFGTCTLRVIRPNGSQRPSVELIHADEGYYLSSSNTIVLRGIRGKSGREAEINLTLGTVETF